MTPKSKAEELVKKFLDATNCYSWEAKQCALIAVDEIIKTEPRYPSNVDWDDAGGTHQYYYEEQRKEANSYWQQVKEEIKKL